METEFAKEMARMVDLMRAGGMIRYADAELVFRRHFVSAALARHGGNGFRAAAELGIHRNTLHRFREECDLPILHRGKRVRKSVPKKNVA